MKIELTKKPKEKFQDESNLGFGKCFTDHMIIKKYFDGAWQETKIVPYGPIELQPSATCLHYAQEIFEGLKAFKTSDGKINLFRPSENFKRLNQSAKRLGIPQIDETEFLNDLIKLIEIEKDWIPKTIGTSLYIRPFIIATDEFLGVKAAKNYLYCVILASSGSYYPNGMKPVKIYVEDLYVRAVKGGVGNAKTGGNYAASLIAQERASEMGFDQVLWLDGVHRKYVEEVGAMNVFFVLKDKVITPMLSGSILEGITRKSAIEIIRSFGIEVEERLISIDELLEYYQKGELLEAFGTGTAAVISPIGLMKYQEETMIINDQAIGEITNKLYDTLTLIQYGEIEDQFSYILKI